MKSRDTSGELLVPLGSRDKQWNVLENVSVRNLQNSLVSFELQENFDKCVSDIAFRVPGCHSGRLALINKCLSPVSDTDGSKHNRDRYCQCKFLFDMHYNWFIQFLK